MKKNKIKQKDNLKIKKVLFYTGSAYGFRSLPIWHVYEISQAYPTVLLAEKLDETIYKILSEKKLFPNLEKIIPVKNTSRSLKEMITNNKSLYSEAKEVIEKNNPDVVITAGVVYPFPLYLRRIASRAGALNICPFSPRIFSSKEIKSWIELSDAFQKKYFPFYLNLFISKIKKQLGHFIYYWLLPLMVGELPFIKEPGCIMFNKISGKSADFYISFTKQDYELALKDGMPFEKIYNLSNPYPEGYEKIRKILSEDFSLNREIKIGKNQKIITLIWPSSELGIRKNNKSVIDKKEMQEKRLKTVRLISEILGGWKILIKAHPSTKDTEILEIKKIFESISSEIKVVNHLERAEAYTEISDAILGFAPVSMTLYTASLICPEKIILSVDLNKELLGDGYRDFNGVDYIDNENDFKEALKLIAKGKYHKNKNLNKDNLKDKNFTSFLKLIEYLFNKKNEIYK